MIDWKALALHIGVVALAGAVWALAQYGAQLPAPWGPIGGLALLWLGSSNAPPWLRRPLPVAAKKAPPLLVLTLLLLVGCTPAQKADAGPVVVSVAGNGPCKGIAVDDPVLGAICIGVEDVLPFVPLILAAKGCQDGGCSDGATKSWGDR